MELVDMDFKNQFKIQKTTHREKVHMVLAVLIIDAGNSMTQSMPYIGFSLEGTRFDMMMPVICLKH
jgi:hypothetical protein